jgi:FlaA1/EpsC-like NDP-sugar epimerase
LNPTRDSATQVRIRQGFGWISRLRSEVELDRAIFGPFRNLLSPGRRLPLVVLAHVVLIPIANYGAFWLRFDGAIPDRYVATFVDTIPWLIAVRALTFIPFGLYAGLWRYTGIWDLSRIVGAVGTSSLLFYLLLLYRGFGPAVYPRGVVIIDTLLLICSLSGLRLTRRMLPHLIRLNQGRRVLIIGAGDAGDMIVREMSRGGAYLPVGFIDDDPSKLGRTIQGVKVLGTRADLPRVVARTNAAEALVAIPTASPATIRSFVQLLEGFKVPITTLPSLSELVSGKVGVKNIRPLAIEDLLPRGQVALNTENVRRLVQGKRVLVTGAGGSIGAELCRQLVTLQPSELVLFERYENSLYDVANDLRDAGVGPLLQTVIGDVTDTSRVRSVFAQYRPHLVFHAAAHKHVPLMEANPCEAIKNNVVGTQIIATTSREYGVERFVLISTDKAVNPSSVMGASKRVAELIVQAIGATARDTRFVTVRFGNVLGSNGSVIPRMLDQIHAGGPVTVTHPEIRRYFMLIPEAVQLVLQAAALARDREVFVLEMGEQIKVLDVARNLIRLSGFVPDEEIPITFIGLRPGEKLVEELSGEGEVLEPASVEKVLRVRRTDSVDEPMLSSYVAALVDAAVRGQPAEVIAHLCRIVPTFRPDESLERAGGDQGSRSPVTPQTVPS